MRCGCGEQRAEAEAGRVGQLRVQRAQLVRVRVGRRCAQTPVREHTFGTHELKREKRARNCTQAAVLCSAATFIELIVQPKKVNKYKTSKLMREEVVHEQHAKTADECEQLKTRADRQRSRTGGNGAPEAAQRRESKSSKALCRRPEVRRRCVSELVCGHESDIHQSYWAAARPMHRARSSKRCARTNHMARTSHPQGSGLLRSRSAASSSQPLFRSSRKLR